MEVFDTALHVPAVVGLLFEQRVRAKGFKHALGIDAAPEAILYLVQEGSGEVDESAGCMDTASSESSKDLFIP